MTRAEKTQLIEELTEKFQESKFFYLINPASMNVADTNAFRRACFEKGIQMKAVKNKLVMRALERVTDAEYDRLMPHLKGATAILFSESGKTPAVVLKDFRGEDGEIPALKAAYIDQDVIEGDDQIEFLTKLKSKEDLLGELITLLESPAKNLVSALTSSEQKLAGLVSYGPNTLAGLLQAIEDKAK